MYKTKCPECGAEDLWVVYAVWEGEAILKEDGFLIGSGNTSDEIVKCRHCDAKFELSKLIEE